MIIISGGSELELYRVFLVLCELASWTLVTFNV